MAMNAPESPSKRRKIHHDTPIVHTTIDEDKDRKPGEVASLRIITLEQFVTTLRLLQSQIGHMNTVEIKIVKKTDESGDEWTGFEIIALENAGAIMVKSSVYAEVQMFERAKIEDLPLLTCPIGVLLGRLSGIQRCTSLVFYVDPKKSTLRGVAKKMNVEREFTVPLLSSAADSTSIRNHVFKYDETVTITASSVQSICTLAKGNPEDKLGIALYAPRSADVVFFEIDIPSDEGPVSEKHIAPRQRGVVSGSAFKHPSTTSHTETDITALVKRAEYPANCVAAFITRVPAGKSVHFRFNTEASESLPLYMCFSDGKSDVNLFLAPFTNNMD